ncbi:hypothetical protein POJ06DRAFT_242169 [Lipomyces tetrasporus]|uniref:Diaminopimelate epimerase-like protein n=1 Tax=Lipomyces tetrasporus TaxID=54092 RepID=A0AAD7R0S3_9ASCO|nr:uncharacterized protein POJ06DRAFT_242169 [Lipomyces tetrasporus]KAJ8103532.1 hypothetical protein POJ06DRAFT_242169 [Lipomyces tetrasporus]
MAQTIRLPFVTLDVFTNERYAGNPLAVVRVPQSQTISQEQKQIIAREFNYSETVILHDEETEYRAGASRTIDIFMTDAELPFAGHPTIGTACLLGAAGIGNEHDESQIQGTIVTKTGPIPFRYDSITQAAYAEVPHNFHIHKRHLSLAETAQRGFAKLLSENIVCPSPFVSIVKGMTSALVQLSSNEILSAVTPGQPDLGDDLDRPWHSESSLLCLYFFVNNGMRANGTVSLSTRMVVGSLEDPATGSAALGLSAYLAIQMLQDHPRSDLTSAEEHWTSRFEIEQGLDMGRLSRIETEVWLNRTTKEVQKVVLGGSAVKVMEGHLSI